MKLYFITCVISFFSTKVSSQNFLAVYAIEKIQTFYVSKNVQKSITFNYTGYLYKKNNLYISFFKPLFLKDYLNSYTEISPGNFVEVNLDTMQAISYIDLDSNIVRSRNDASSNAIITYNNLRTTYPGLMKWKIMPETKIIQGLNCQRALLDYNGKTNYCEVWFCSDISIPITLRNLRDLPGLVVEANYYSVNETYKLVELKRVDTFPKNVFWPNEFYQPFRDLTNNKK